MDTVADPSVSQPRIMRLGRFQNGKIRPIKLIFSSNDCVKKIFHKISDVKNVPNFKDVNFSNDYTVVQMKAFKKLKAEMEQRKSENPSLNLDIRHINGNPVIVNSKKSKN